MATVGGGAAAWVYWSRPAPVMTRPAVIVAPPTVAAPPAVVAPPSVAPPVAAPLPALAAPTPVIAPPPIAAPVPEFLIEMASEAQIRANVATGLTIFRFADNRQVLVLDFATLADQGAMLNRLAAFAEKAGAPHDRVLTDGDLDQLVRRGGGTPETFYYGHDYRAADVARFFAAADRDHVALNRWEEALRRLVRQEGWLTEGAVGGLISIPRAGADAEVTPAARATTLRHELSHGEYFTNPAYTAYAHQFWTTTLTDQERAAVQRFLARAGYDPALQDVIENEAQAYLIFTDGAQLLTPSMVGMTEARRNELRTNFLRNVPVQWMRQSVWVMPARH